ncbi:chromosomal replication initiator protein DnaA [Deltaproteobacteria bacterium Smac51]|nr:chromosomal replication initiator protein DnaA [Deltaproteobacteria bacterium Smac51]
MENEFMQNELTTTETSVGAGELENVWATARQSLANRLSPGNFKTWIEPLKARGDEDGRLVLAGPNNFFVNWVKSHFCAEISTALASTGFQAESRLAFAADHELSDSSRSSVDDGLCFEKAPSSPEPSRRVSESLSTLGHLRSAQPLRNNGRFTFENFVVGDSNLYAFSAAKALAAGAALGADSLFITSDHGLGKSHLSMALGQAFLQNKPRNNVYYLTAEDFTNEMTHAIRHSSMEDFKAKYRQLCDVLVLEEIQFLGGKEKIQSELCFTLDCLMERGKKVVFTSPQEPRNIPRLGRSLRSRLSTALVSPIGPPEYDTRLNILLKKAKTLDLKVSRGILEFVAERVTSDVRQLESCLVSLKAKSQLLGRQVDMDMAREALAYIFDDGEGEGLTPLTVRSMVCRHYHLEVGEITSKDRSSKVNQARSLGMYLSRQLTGRTLDEIGKVFGRTHSSALYAINKLEQQLKKDPKLQGTVEFFSQRLFTDK